MSEIPWTEENWDVTGGCTQYAEGCRNCWALYSVWRLAHRGVERYAGLVKKHKKRNKLYWTNKVKLYPELLDVPVKRRKPTTYFVCSKSDLFHEDVPFDFIDKVFDVIWQTNHTYQILTKRPARILEYLKYTKKTHCRKSETDPRPKIWTGTSISTQEDADKNIPILLKIPAAVRFLSIEPMLERIDFTNYELSTIDWLILGCESGSKARLCGLDDIDYVIDQCRAAGVPIFLKQIPLNGRCNKHPEQWPEKYQGPDLRQMPKGIEN